MKVRSEERPCRHCEARPALDARGLCTDCGGAKGIRKLYRMERGKEWERHLRALARRARRGLPLGGLSLAETL